MPIAVDKSLMPALHLLCYRIRDSVAIVCMYVSPICNPERYTRHGCLWLKVPFIQFRYSRHCSKIQNKNHCVTTEREYVIRTELTTDITAGMQSSTPKIGERPRKRGRIKIQREKQMKILANDIQQGVFGRCSCSWCKCVGDSIYLSVHCACDGPTGLFSIEDCQNCPEEKDNRNESAKHRRKQCSTPTYAQNPTLREKRREKKESV